MKLDIEGAEADVLRELADSGRIRRIEQMAIEYHHHIIAGEDRLASTLSLLERCGFGYGLGAKLARPFERGRFQDIMIYAYRK